MAKMYGNRGHPSSRKTYRVELNASRQKEVPIFTRCLHSAVDTIRFFTSWNLLTRLLLRWERTFYLIWLIKNFMTYLVDERCDSLGLQAVKVRKVRYVDGILWSLSLIDSWPNLIIIINICTWNFYLFINMNNYITVKSPRILWCPTG